MTIAPINLGDANSRAKINSDLARGNAQELTLAGHDIAIGDLQAATNALAADKTPLAVTIAMQVEQAAIRDDVVRDDARPGDAPRTFAATLAGGPVESLGPLPTTGPVVSAAGAVWPLYGESAVVERGYTAIDPGRVYAVRGDVERIVNAIDPDGDAVRLGMAWYNASKVLIGSTALYEWKTDTVPLTTVSGRQSMTKRVARAVGAGIDFAAPAGTVYGRAFVQVFGGTQRTDVIRLQTADVTDQNAWSPDVSGLDGRLTALESENLPAQIADIVATLEEPNSTVYRTINDAVAATIPMAVTSILILGQANAADTSIAKRYHAETTEPATQGSFQDAGGRWWRPTEDRGPAVFGMENLVKLRLSILQGSSGGGDGKIHIDVFGNSIAALASAGGGFDGGLDKIFDEMRASTGRANLVFHYHGVGSTDWSDANLALLHPYSAMSIWLFDTNGISVSVAYAETESRSKLTALRALRPFGEHDIVIVAAPSSNKPDDGRDYRRHEQLRAVNERRCRDFKTAVIDTFAMLPDSRALGGLVMDPIAVHPYLPLSRRIWGQFWREVFLFEEYSYRAFNIVRNYLYDDAPGVLVREFADPPGIVEAGISIWRATTDEGWPINGMLIEHRQADGVVLQTLSGLFSAETEVYFRSNTAAGPNSNSNLDWTTFVKLQDFDKAWTASTPAATSSAVSGGAVYPVATCAMRHRKIGRMVHFAATITVAANNDGSGSLLLTMPFEAAGGNVFIGRESATSGVACIGQMIAGATAMAIVTVANAYPATNGSVITVSGSYEATA